MKKPSLTAKMAHDMVKHLSQANQFVKKKCGCQMLTGKGCSYKLTCNKHSDSTGTGSYGGTV